jgi:hypothetical protein
MKNYLAQLFAARALVVAVASLVTPLSAQTSGGAPATDTSAGFSSSFAFAASGRTDLKSGGTDFGSIRVRDYSLSVGQSITPEFNVGLGYELHTLDLGAGAATTPLPTRLKSLTASFSYSQKLSEKWTGVLFASPVCHVAGGSFSGQGFGVTTGVLATCKSSETYSWAIGVAYDSLARGEFRVLPVGGLEWKFAPGWSLALGFPRTAISYQVSDALQISLCAEGNFGSYYVQDDPTPGAPGKPSLARTRLEYSEARTGLAASYKLSPSSALVATIGEAFDRRFDYHVRHFKLKSRDTAAYASLACSVGF